MCNANIILSQEELCAAVRYHFESTKRFLSAAAVLILESFVRIEDARYELQLYRGEYIRNKFPGASNDMVPRALNAVYDDYLHDCDRAIAELEFILGVGAAAGRARKICRFF